MRKTIAIILATSALALSACNTVAGAGRDISSVGKEAEKAGDKHK